MQYTVLVQVGDGIYNALCCPAGLELAELFLRKNHVEKFTALHELHDEAPVAVVLEHLNQLNDVWMIKLLENLDLCQHCRLVFVAHLPLGHDLDREPLAGFSMLSALHRGEAAATYRCLDFVDVFDVLLQRLHIDFTALCTRYYKNN